MLAVGSDAATDVWAFDTIELFPYRHSRCPVCSLAGIVHPASTKALAKNMVLGLLGPGTAPNGDVTVYPIR